MLRDSIKNALFWLFPKGCIICGAVIEEGAVFCCECFSKVTFIGNACCSCCGRLLDIDTGAKALCDDCQLQKMYFDEGRSLFVYDDKTKPLLMKIKNKESLYEISVCAKLIAVRYKDFLSDIDLILPVPSHWLRLIFKRNYNPPSLIASELCRSIGGTSCDLIDKIMMGPASVEFKENLLRRVVRTKYQKNKTKAERIENVKNAFLCRRSKLIKNKRVLIVDDTITTGATINECARVLKEAGASYVKFVTIASALCKVNKRLTISTEPVENSRKSRSKEGFVWRFSKMVNN
jgi:ComF family protein